MVKWIKENKVKNNDKDIDKVLTINFVLSKDYEKFRNESLLNVNKRFLKQVNDYWNNIKD